MPQAWFDYVTAPLLNRPNARSAMMKLLYAQDTSQDQAGCSGWASLAKVAGTDFGLVNCQMAMEIMGEAGLRQDTGMEKILRDAKLLQIYEGTNQLNRLNLFKDLIGPAAPAARVFVD
jgi:alkylation response protein AidB-like acyl-CoA dehydrogenase